MRQIAASETGSLAHRWTSRLVSALDAASVLIVCTLTTCTTTSIVLVRKAHCGSPAHCVSCAAHACEAGSPDVQH